HLLWTHGPDGRPLARLPAELARALDPHIERLCRRSDYRGGPAWQLFRIALADAPCRVIWPDLARRLAAAVPDAGVVPLNTVYGIATRAADDAYALARSKEHTSELQSPDHLVCRLLLEKKKRKTTQTTNTS